MLKTSALALLLTASLCQAAEPRMSVVLKCYVPGSTTPLPVVENSTPPTYIAKVGEEYDLALIAQDLRPEAEGMKRGVYSVYVNISHAKRYGEVQWLLDTQPFFNPYRKKVVFTNAGFGPWGGYAGFQFGGGTEPVEVSRTRIKALWPTTLIDPSISKASTIIKLDFNGLLDWSKPTYNALLHGTQAPGGSATVYYPGEQPTLTLADIKALGTRLEIHK